VPKTLLENEKCMKRRLGRIEIEKQPGYPKYIKHSMENIATTKERDYDLESMEKMTSTDEQTQRYED
jgi:hypothetical protein